MYRLKTTIKTAIILLFISSFSMSTFGKVALTKLVCEYHENPIGIDVVKPRLSWQLVSEDKNVSQTAYEIRVAKSESDLSKKSKQIWSTGKVDSDKSVNVVYEGSTLKSMERAYWQVRVWDNKGKASDWSESAYWEMGLLGADDWKASWITLQGEPKIKGSKPAHYYRNEFSTTKKIKSARVYVTSLGLYQLFLNGKKVGNQLFTPGWTSFNKRLQYQTYDVTSLLKKDNAIGAVLGDGWYRGYIAWKDQIDYYGDELALLMQLQINYTDGSSETIVTDKNWYSSNGPILESDYTMVNCTIPA